MAAPATTITTTDTLIARAAEADARFGRLIDAAISRHAGRATLPVSGRPAAHYSVGDVLKYMDEQN